MSRLSIVRDCATYVCDFARHPAVTGAIAPSSRQLARMMIEGVLLPTDRTLVEYGPGTGIFTTEILANKHPDAQFIAIERSPRMAQQFRTLFPKVSLCEDSVENLPSILAAFDVESVDCVVSGLPWALFTEESQERILTATCSALGPGGRFATFAYIHGLILPAARRFEKKLASHFREVARSPVVWRNLPPALVYRCTL